MVSLQRIALGLSLILLAGSAPAAAQSDVVGPAVTPGQRRVDPKEQSIAQQYAKLIQDVKTSKAALEDEIEELERRIEALKKQASRVELIAQKTQQVLPKILAAVEPGSGGGRAAAPAARLEDLGALLGAELSKAGVETSPDELRWVVEAIGRGGPGAGSRVSAQAAERIERTHVAIDATGQRVEELRGQVEVLDEEIASLQKERDRALAEQQKQKAIEDARRRRESTAERIPAKP
jgi:polyhydroxyalkanoate synthesis regulator phasin